MDSVTSITGEEISKTMMILDQYLTRQITAGLLMATLILLPLFSFLDFVEQLDDAGQGFYTNADAFLYVIMTLPRRFIQLAPFIALLGNVAALGRLAVNLELVSLRAAGYSPLQTGMASLKVGLALLLFIVALEQFIAPPLHQKAIAMRAAALDQGAELGRNLGIWTRNKEQILRIGNIQHDTRQSPVEILTLDEQGMLSEYLHADGFEIINNNKWVLYTAVRKTLQEGTIATSTEKSVMWNTFLNPEQISTLTKPHESLSPAELFRYISYLKSTGQEYQAYELALWRKLGSVLTMLGMLLLSIPFVFGSIRAGFANRLVLAGITGIGVYLMDQIFSNAGLLLDLSPQLIAILPGFLLISISVLWLGRLR